MANSDETAELRTRFASNLQRLMEERSLTVRETAKKAGIADLRSFYRWAKGGISRATQKHDADLERLQKFFGLSTVKQFWMNPNKPSKTDYSLSQKLCNAGEIEWEYGSAYKVLVVLKSLDGEELSEFHRLIEMMFEEATFDRTTDEILEPKNGDQIMSFIQINYPDAFEAAVRSAKGGLNNVISVLDNEIKRRGSPKGFLDEIIVWALKKLKEETG